MLARRILQGTRIPVASSQQCRMIWNKYKELNRDVLVKVQKDYDVSAMGFLKYLDERRWHLIKQDHLYSRERHETLGSDLSAAHFIVARGGMVKAVGSDTWVKKEEGRKKYNLPDFHDPNWKLEAIEKCDMILFYDSFSNLVNLEHLRYLGLKKGKYIDDWCLDALLAFRDSLVVLDISECKNITEKGLATLRRLKKLKRLRMYNMTGIKNPGLTLLMLEEMLPNVVIETDIQYDSVEEPTPEPSIMQNLKEQDLENLPGLIKDLDLNMRTHTFKS